MRTEVCVLGRPRNIAEVCKVCGRELNFQTARETKKGSGSLRSTCLECERKKSRERAAAAYVKKNTKKISRGPMFAERPNRFGMSVQDSEVIRIYNNKSKYITIFHDKRCDECNSIIRYDEHLNRVCTECGLIDGITIFDEPNSEFTGRQWKSYEKSKYKKPYIHVNKDGEFDRQNADNAKIVHDRYEPDLEGGTSNPVYSSYYEKKLDGPKRYKKYWNRIEKIGRRSKDESFSRRN